MTDEVIEGRAEEVGTDVVVTPRQNATLFNTEDPDEVLQKASKVATSLKDVVEQAGLIANIKGKKHPQVEAWQTLGSMLGVAPVPVGEPKPIPWPDPVPSALKGLHEQGLSFGFSAAYTAMKAGEAVGGGQARCMRTESSWRTTDDNALASMAQTRAISKAMRGPLAFIMVLAGYSPTPAEEMATDGQQQAPAPTASAVPPEPKTLTDEQRDKVLAAVEAAEQPLPLILAAVGVTDAEHLTTAHARVIRDMLDRAS